MKAPSRVATACRHLFQLVRSLHPAARRRIAAWECADGLTFMRNMGIVPGKVVLDFGSGLGRYSAPAAFVVGERGRVCAVEQDPIRRRRLARRARALGLQNVRLAAKLENAAEALDGRRCDVVLAYDVLHFMDAAERRRVYGKFRELMAERGLLSVHPKHVRDDIPRRYFRDMTVEEVVREIEAAGFRFRERLVCTLWHDHGTAPGAVLNFERPERPATGTEAI